MHNQGEKMILKLFKSSLVIILLVGCHNDNTNQPPWIDLTWVNPIRTNIIFHNQLKTEQTFEINYFNKTTREVQNKKFNLKSGQVDSLAINIFRPELIKLLIGNETKTLYLLPKMSLELSLSDSIETMGANKNTYATLFEVGDHQKDKRIIDSILNIQESPIWLKDYINKSNEFKKSHEIYHQANYQQYMGLEGIAPSEEDSLEAERLLQNVKEGVFHNYYAQLQVDKYNYKFRRENKAIVVKNEPYELRKNLMGFLLNIEEEKIRNEMIAMHTEGILIRKRKSFKDKDKIYSDIIRNLPEPYVLRLNEIEKEYSVLDYDRDEVVELLHKEISSTDGEKNPLSENLKEFKLLKFWFAGCAPCKKQIPFENKLLEEYDNLDILHFCKSTKYEVWEDYIIKTKSKGKHFYISDEHLQEYISVFNLSYSPRYVLLDKENQIVCWDCANPDNAELKQLLN